MSVQDTIREQVTGHPVVLYMKGSPQMPMCGFSATANRNASASVSAWPTAQGHARIISAPPS